jgi:hypothetical protein
MKKQLKNSFTNELLAEFKKRVSHRWGTKLLRFTAVFSYLFLRERVDIRTENI